MTLAPDRELAIRDAIQAVQDTNFSKGFEAVELLRGSVTSLLAEVATQQDALRRILMWASPVGADYDEDTAFTEIRRIAREQLPWIEPRP